MPCVSLWKWMFHKRNKNRNQLILRGPPSPVKLPVSCIASCWSLQFVPTVSENRPGQSWHSASLTGLLTADGISGHVCRRLLDIRQSCWVARAPHCPRSPATLQLRYVALSGILWIPAALPDTGDEVKRSRQGWFAFILRLVLTLVLRDRASPFSHIAQKWPSCTFRSASAAAGGAGFKFLPSGSESSAVEPRCSLSQLMGSNN